MTKQIMTIVILTATMCGGAGATAHAPAGRGEAERRRGRQPAAEDLLGPFPAQGSGARWAVELASDLAGRASTADRLRARGVAQACGRVIEACARRR